MFLLDIPFKEIFYALPYFYLKEYANFIRLYIINLMLVLLFFRFFPSFFPPTSLFYIQLQKRMLLFRNVPKYLFTSILQFFASFKIVIFLRFIFRKIPRAQSKVRNRITRVVYLFYILKFFKRYKSQFLKTLELPGILHLNGFIPLVTPCR